MKKAIILAIAVALVLCSCATGAVEEVKEEKEVYVPVDVVVIKRTSREFSSLTAALEAAVSGDEIVMYKDETLSESLKITQNVTIDLNGHTINGASIANQKDTGCLNLAGTKAEKLNKIVIKNGTINGAFSGSSASGGAIRGFYVNQIVLENLNVINTANDKADAHSISVYVTYCGLTINNTDANTFQGKLLIYDNASVSGAEGGLATSVTIKGGVFTNDPNSADGEVIRFASKGKAVPTVAENAVFKAGTITCNNLATADESFTAKAGTYCFDPTKYVDASKYSISAADGKWTVTAK